MKDKIKYTIMIIFLFLIDRFFKILVVKYLKNTITLIPNFLKLTYVKNIGAAFSLMEGEVVCLIVISLLIFIYLYKELITKNIYIPMSPEVESLNAAVAASIIMYEMSKKDYE